MSSLLLAGFDPSQYKTRLDALSQVPTFTTTFQSMLNVTGKGYIDKSLVTNTNGNSSASQMRITIDGTVIFLSTSTTNTASRCIGVCREDFITNAQSAGATARYMALGGYIYILDGFTVLPYTGNAAVVGVMNEPIYFNQSCLIESLNPSGGTYWLEIKGAMM